MASKLTPEERAKIEEEGKNLIAQYERVEQEQTRINQSQQQLRSQLLENQGVSGELELLDDDAEVFKALGPVLVKMDLADAKATVKQRLDRFDTEMCVCCAVLACCTCLAAFTLLLCFANWESRWIADPPECSLAPHKRRTCSLKLDTQFKEKNAQKAGFQQQIAQLQARVNALQG